MWCEDDEYQSYYGIERKRRMWTQAVVLSLNLNVQS